jgi:hypothetical protein
MFFSIIVTAIAGGDYMDSGIVKIDVIPDSHKPGAVSEILIG